MVANITPDEADQLNDELAGLRGIQMIEYDDTTAHYNNVSALYSITFDYPEDDDQCLETLESVKEYLKDYDIYVSTSLGNTQEETIEREVNVIMVYVAIIIVVVLIFTSQTYAEVPVLLLTFVVGMILNMGTNFLLGTISFVSNSVTNILQLMERKGYIQRLNVPQDARLKQLVLTEEGVRFHENTILSFHQTDDYVANLLTEEENAELLRLLNKLRDALK